jgi:hypothetical protein
MIGNTNLVHYGIQNDKSDYRAHVCVNAKAVYIFETSKAAKLVKEKTFKKVTVFTDAIKTATGFIVPWQDIPDLHVVSIPQNWMDKIQFSEDEQTTKKGEKAVKIVKGILKKGMVPIIMEGQEVEDTDMQVAGFDITINININIQVKCDYRGGGVKGRDTTGNLFLQISECNPFKRI